MLITDNQLRLYVWMRTDRHAPAAGAYIVHRGRIYICGQVARDSSDEFWPSGAMRTEEQLVAAGYRQVSSLAEVQALMPRGFTLHSIFVTPEMLARLEQS